MGTAIPPIKSAMEKGVPDWEIAQAYKVEKLQDLTKAQQGNAMASLMAMPNKETK